MHQPPTVVITGSASGIGYGLARAFLARGCNVMVADLAGERLNPGFVLASLVTRPDPLGRHGL